MDVLLFFSFLHQEVVLPEVVVVVTDEHVRPRSLQPPAQEVPPLAPLLELLLAVGVVAAHALGTAGLQPVDRSHHALKPGLSEIIRLVSTRHTARVEMPSLLISELLRWAWPYILIISRLG